MHAVVKAQQARPRPARKPLRKLPKQALADGRDRAPDDAPPRPQQAATEPGCRAPGDWPPNTWWP
jgi:hypothetical protein